MRCPKCGYDHKKKYGNRCRCGYTFVFDPVNDKITDGKFAAALRAVHGDGLYAYTFNQFYATLCRRSRLKRRSILITYAVSGAFLLLAGYFNVSSHGKSVGVFVCGMLALMVGLSATTQLYKRPPDIQRVRTFVKRWRAAGNEMPGYIAEPSLHEPPPPGPESDLFDYGVDRILIVERDLLVDWLVLNNFHATERTAVISQKGYPDYVYQRVVQLLQDNPNVKVHLLHDATAVGSDLHAAIVSGRHHLSPLFARKEILDLGLNEVEVKRMRLLRPFRRTPAGVPVDFMPYGMLSRGLGASMMMGVALMHLPPRSQHEPGDSGYG